MSSADQADQDQADELVRAAGGVTPLNGLAMAMLPDRTLRVVAHFEDSDERRRTCARGRSWPSVTRRGGGSPSPTTSSSRSSSARGNDVVLDLHPREKTGYVLSALYDGPVLFATC